MITCVFQNYPENFTFQLSIILPKFQQFLLSFLFINKTLRLNNLKTRTAMYANISVFVICVEAILNLLLHNLHDSTFKDPFNFFGKSD